MAGQALTALLTVAEFRAARAHIFPSEGSLQWYMRQNRLELIRAGALLVIAGRHFIQAEPFDAYVVSAGSAAAASRGQGVAS